MSLALAALVAVEMTLCLLVADWLWRVTPWSARRVGLAGLLSCLGMIALTLAFWAH
ncbi:hypothetical protein [Acidihalobacter ferrooxydans]|uniref:hypothetical protein n=1 Tax=Acidihalobacter ferrooxydans TaxID=1765967 RepID=UPI0012EBE02A|nr:hypothetical protein [Acidihalobacter ferrooxydans]